MKKTVKMPPVIAVIQRPLTCWPEGFKNSWRRKEKRKINKIKGITEKEKADFGFTNFTCFGCDQQGYIKIECPNLVHKGKGQEKKYSKSGKAKKAYIAWKDNDTSSSSSSKEDEEANMCLMVEHHSEASSVSSSISMNYENYTTLLQE